MKRIVMVLICSLFCISLCGFSNRNYALAYSEKEIEETSLSNKEIKTHILITVCQEYGDITWPYLGVSIKFPRISIYTEEVKDEVYINNVKIKDHMITAEYQNDKRVPDRVFLEAFIRFPQIYDMEDKTIQDKVNKQLKDSAVWSINHDTTEETLKELDNIVNGVWDQKKYMLMFGVAKMNIRLFMQERKS